MAPCPAACVVRAAPSRIPPHPGCAPLRPIRGPCRAPEPQRCCTSRQPPLPQEARRSLAVPGLPPAPTSPPPLPAQAPEPVLPSPPVAADAAAVLLAAGVPPVDLRRAAGMCPELLSVPAEAIVAALRFLTGEAGVPEADLPRVLRRRPRLLVSHVAARLRPTLYFLRALGVPDLHRRADLLSFSVEDHHAGAVAKEAAAAV
ncbi:uncharacterized protein [Setaria viridis]|uniref:uncharacterized protein n=1 Tax=Setaria viridis TaxID=4556 RepID=UPI003B3B64AD